MKALLVSAEPRATDRAVAAVNDAGLASLFASRVQGPFGHTSLGLYLLESMVAAVDLGLAAEASLRGLILEETAAPGSFAVPTLGPEQQRFVGAFQIVVTADALLRRADERLERPTTSGGLELDGLGDLLERDADDLARHVLTLARAFVSSKDDAVEALVAFVVMLRAGVLELCNGGSLRPLARALAERDVSIGGHTYDGLSVRTIADDASGLIDVAPGAIVGNDAYLEAGLRLAQDVAAYDFDAKKNPKRINPVLFGLGRPGSGKTITAHAIGNAFLEHCRRRDVPAKFVVVRRTDWASSYQNASASNLVRIFREAVYGFDGVAGVYWPDIDTAFASRAANDLRMEEKQNLGAVFGIFDGTLIPKDGRWFLICDANTMNMDEATVSRIAQDPHTVSGPATSDDYVRLMRDIMLSDLSPFLPEDWAPIGARAVELDLSGRNVEAIANGVRGMVQDFAYPDTYFEAGAEERANIVRTLSKRVSADQILARMDRWDSVQRDARERTDRERFAAEVEAIVRRLNATRAAERVLE